MTARGAIGVLIGLYLYRRWRIASAIDDFKSTARKFIPGVIP
jgi:hypothetical protein